MDPQPHCPRRADQQRPEPAFRGTPWGDRPAYRSHDFSVRIRFALVGFLSLLIGESGVAGASRPPAPPIKVHIALAKHRVMAGQPIKATVLLTNTAHRAITVNACAQNGWLQVGLKGHGYAYAANSLLILCPHSIRLAPGANRYPVTVITTYEGCVQPGGGRATPQTPFCASKGLPALPPGNYSTVVSIMGLEHLTRSPNRIAVTLTEPG